MKATTKKGAWVIDISLTPSIEYNPEAVADGWYIHETFAKAKSALLKELRNNQRAWTDAIKHTNSLKANYNIY
jgi:hypothetical protein